MAIQMRRGDYADFDPTKLVAGELAVVTSGDPNSDTGRALYICFEPGIVKRVTDYEDLIDQINAATQEIQQRFTASVEQSARDALSFAESASSSAGTASSASESATAASQSASSAQAAAESAAAAAKDAKEYVDQHGTKPMTGATATATGTAGTVPAPQAGTSTRFLCSDATWKEAVDATQGKAINDAIAKNAADIATNKSGISKNKADITALNSSLSNISGTATPYGVFTTQDIKYIKFGRIVVVTGWVNTGAVQNPTTGYPLGQHFAIATIPFKPYGGSAPLAAYCTNAESGAQVWVEDTNIVFKSQIDPFSNAIYLAGAFIVA